MLDNEEFDFSKETDIKDKLLKKCLDKQKELNKEHLRKPITFEELTDFSKKEVTKIDMNKSKSNEIKIEKDKS